jgi:hypothetical protein
MMGTASNSLFNCLGIWNRSLARERNVRGSVLELSGGSVEDIVTRLRVFHRCD